MSWHQSVIVSPTGILWAHSRADLRVVGQQVCSFSFFRGNAAAAADFSTEFVLVPGARYIAVAAGVPDLGNKRPVIPPTKSGGKRSQHTGYLTTSLRWCHHLLIASKALCSGHYWCSGINSWGTISKRRMLLRCVCTSQTAPFTTHTTYTTYTNHCWIHSLATHFSIVLLLWISFSCS